VSNHPEEKTSFIAEARREQIMNGAIATLDEIGYAQSSLSQIAKRAGVSTALISYHFVDKSDLMNHLLMKLMERSATYIMDRVAQATTARQKLDTFIEASLAYQGTNPAHYIALLEIVFHARTPDNISYYRVEDDEDVIQHELQQILREGQATGEFSSFHVEVLASMIQGAVGEYMSSAAITRQVDLETYGQELIRMVRTITIRTEGIS